MILIRKATVKDAEAIATHLLLAMEDIVYKFIGVKDPRAAFAFLLHFAKAESNQYSYQNCWVVEDESEIVAAVNVYDGARLHELRQPVLEYISSKFQIHIAPEDETSAGEYYIDSLGVRPSRRGQGIGSEMLHYLVDEFVTRRRLTLGLLVDEENPDAKRLYLKLGFEHAGRRLFLGKYMQHLQIKA